MPDISRSSYGIDTSIATTDLFLGCHSQMPLPSSLLFHSKVASSFFLPRILLCSHFFVERGAAAGNIYWTFPIKRLLSLSRLVSRACVRFERREREKATLGNKRLRNFICQQRRKEEEEKKSFILGRRHS